MTPSFFGSGSASNPKKSKKPKRTNKNRSETEPFPSFDPSYVGDGQRDPNQRNRAKGNCFRRFCNILRRRPAEQAPHNENKATSQGRSLETQSSDHKYVNNCVSERSEIPATDLMDISQPARLVHTTRLAVIPESDVCERLEHLCYHSPSGPKPISDCPDCRQFAHNLVNAYTGQRRELRSDETQPDAESSSSPLSRQLAHQMDGAGSEGKDKVRRKGSASMLSRLFKRKHARQPDAESSSSLLSRQPAHQIDGAGSSSRGDEAGRVRTNSWTPGDDGANEKGGAGSDPVDTRGGAGLRKDLPKSIGDFFKQKIIVPIRGQYRLLKCHLAEDMETTDSEMALPDVRDRVIKNTSEDSWSKEPLFETRRYPNPGKKQRVDSHHPPKYGPSNPKAYKDPVAKSVKKKMNAPPKVKTLPTPAESHEFQARVGTYIPPNSAALAMTKTKESTATVPTSGKCSCSQAYGCVPLFRQKSTEAIYRQLFELEKPTARCPSALMSLKHHSGSEPESKSQHSGLVEKGGEKKSSAGVKTILLPMEIQVFNVSQISSENPWAEFEPWRAFWNLSDPHDEIPDYSSLDSPDHSKPSYIEKNTRRFSEDDDRLRDDNFRRHVWEESLPWSPRLIEWMPTHFHDMESEINLLDAFKTVEKKRRHSAASQELRESRKRRRS